MKSRHYLMIVALLLITTFVSSLGFFASSGVEGNSVNETNLDSVTTDVSTMADLADYMIRLRESLPADPQFISPENIYSGYTLYHEMNSVQDIEQANETFLMDESGKIVHQWGATLHSPEGSGVYLLENGLLLRSGSHHTAQEMEDFPVGAHGTVQLLDWDGNVVWEYTRSEKGKHVLHHDMEPLPNGNILVTSYEAVSVEQGEKLGWTKTKGASYLWGEKILELKPNLRDNTTEIVWEWSSFDHIVQDIDPHKANYGVISENPSRIDINYPNKYDTETGASGILRVGERLHVNTLDYNEALDQVMMSSYSFNEIWIVDRKRPEEGLIYRFGNPAAYGMGTREDQLFFVQHDAQWIEEGLPNAGKILVHNNGFKRPKTENTPPSNNPMDMFTKDVTTNIYIFSLPAYSNGLYEREDKKPFGPDAFDWEYDANGPGASSPFMSGAKQLPNGNILISNSMCKKIYEVDPNGKTVFSYRLPGGGQIFKAYKYPKDYRGILGRLTHAPLSES